MNLQEVANRRLEVKKTSIEDQKRKKIQESKAETEQKIRGIQNLHPGRGDPASAAAAASSSEPGRLRSSAGPREPGGQPEPAGMTGILPHRLTTGRRHRLAP